MTIYYIANIRLPTERAHGAQIMKTCEAFARAGHSVELMVPARANHLTDSPFAYYGVEENFTVTYVPVVDWVRFGFLGFLAETFSFALAAKRALRMRPEGMIYGRDEWVLAGLVRRRMHPVVWESHTGAWSTAARAVLRRARRLVVISQGLKDFYVERGVPADSILVARDGVDLAAFAAPESKAAARRRLSLPSEAKVAMYVGGLGSGKGADVFCEAAALLPEGARAAVIGGSEQEIAACGKKYPSVLFLGTRPYRELADNQAAADVLVVPNTAASDASARFTSPLKLFAAMASGVPIVASDVPALREVVNEQSAVLIPPGDPTSLAEAVRGLFDDPARAAALAARALRDVRAYSWDERAACILSLWQKKEP